MSDSVTIDLQENAPHRVAFDLAMRIAKDDGSGAKRDREYWLKLYAQCRQVVVSGQRASDALKLS